MSLNEVNVDCIFRLSSCFIIIFLMYYINDAVHVRRLTNFNMFIMSEIKTVLFYVILIISMISLFTDYNNMVIFIFKLTFMLHYIE